MSLGSKNHNKGGTVIRKYEDKYKQMGDVVSKLTLDQATFGTFKRRRWNYIVQLPKWNKDRAEKIQTDLDELQQALNERCKRVWFTQSPHHSWSFLSAGNLVYKKELLIGMKDGTNLTMMMGLQSSRNLPLKLKNVVAPERLKPTLENSAQVPASIASHLSENSAKDKEPASLAEVEHKSDNYLSSRELITETELGKADDEDGLTKASPVSPGKSAIDSPSQGSTSHSIPK
ncbi:hypothetical protein HPP92_022721 [Vanilla planifolia]|uniref:Uncharacterized protein n=1 Tax=Vanilla planifolia TaxID=51239 RepID=A0A835PQ61_VANPL|nr:hypothetical protein HPP92_022721 [Vanilla planifolia]